MTNAKEQLIQELDQTPDFVVQEVLDFLLFIKVRLKHKIKEEQTNSLQHPPSLPPFLQFVEEISAQVPRELAILETSLPEPETPTLKLATLTLKLATPTLEHRMSSLELGTPTLELQASGS